jgi:SAM-dependent methyltransferase
MQHDYYKEYYELERRHWWFVAREKIITGYIKKLIIKNHLQQDIRILNVGCSTGRSSEYLSQFGHVTSIEYDKFCCEFAAEKTGLEIIHGSVTELPFEDRTFDLVCAFDVIEHVADDQLAVNEMKRVAKNEGVLFVTVPAFMDLWSHHDVINHHHRRYKEGQLRSLFTNGDSGKKIFSGYFNFFLFLPIYIFRKISNLLGTGEKRSGSGSDFEAFKPGVLNNLLYGLMASERFFTSNNFRLPFGVSILLAWKKGGTGP